MRRQNRLSWGRIKTACTQLLDNGLAPLALFGEQLNPAGPAADLAAFDAMAPTDTANLDVWAKWLRRFSVFFCTPLDLDYSMLRAFLRNHAPDIAAMDLFVVPTIGFDLLYAFVIVRLDRRDLVWINVTSHPTAEWIARQIAEAFPWNDAPRHLIRDRDRLYGTIVTRRLRAMGIRDKPTAPASPWQNGFAERMIGSIRRECVDHIIVLGEAHLRRILQS